MDEIDKTVEGFEPLMGEELIEGIRKIAKRIYRQMRWRQRYQHWRERIFQLYIRNVVLPNKRKPMKSIRRVIIYHFKDKPKRRRVQDIYLGYGYFLRYYSDGTHELFYDPNLTGTFPFGSVKDYNDQGFPIF